MFKYVRLMLATFSFMVCASCLPTPKGVWAGPAKNVYQDKYLTMSSIASRHGFTFSLVLSKHGKIWQDGPVPWFTCRSVAVREVYECTVRNVSEEDMWKFSRMASEPKKLCDDTETQLQKDFEDYADKNIVRQSEQPVVSPHWHFTRPVRYALAGAVTGAVAFAVWKVLGKLEQILL